MFYFTASGILPSRSVTIVNGRPKPMSKSNNNNNWLIAERFIYWIMVHRMLPIFQYMEIRVVQLPYQIWDRRDNLTMQEVSIQAPKCTSMQYLWYREFQITKPESHQCHNLYLYYYKLSKDKYLLRYFRYNTDHCKHADNFIR
jgi:hypothetical protein